MSTDQDDRDDLEDVVITAPVPILYGIHELTVGTVPIADWTIERLGMAVPYRAGHLVDLMEAILVGYDSYRAAANQPVDRAAIHALLRRGESMIDVPDMLGMDWDDCMTAMSGGNKATCYLEWDDARWLRFESSLQEFPSMPTRARCKLMGLTHASERGIRSLMQAYGAPIPGRSAASGPLPDEATMLIRGYVESCVDTPTVRGATDMLAGHGLVLSAEAVKQRLRRARARCVSDTR